MSSRDTTVTVVHPSGKRETGVLSHDRSGTGTQVVVGNRAYSYPRGNDSAIDVIHDGGAGADKRQDRE